jgi:hypothetical protein
MSTASISKLAIEGTHVSRMGAQLLQVFPFFSRALVFDTADK